MPYLSNVAINRLNLHTGLHMLAWNMAGSFFLIFIMSHGLGLMQAYLVFAFQLALRFCLRPIILVIAPRLGLHRTLLIGNGFFMLQYLLLAQVHGINFMFLLYSLAFAGADIFYWSSYHAIFGQLGDAQHRGKQVSVRQAATLITGIFAPLIGGWTLQHLGPVTTFGICAAIQLVAAIPLLRLPPIPVKKHAPVGAFKAGLRATPYFLTDSWISAGLVWGWGLLVFGSAHQNFATFGVVAALGALISVIGNLFLGKVIDAGRAPWVVFINAALLSAAIILRGSGTGDLNMVYAVTAASSLMDACYAPILMTAFYNTVLASPCPLRFMFINEGAWDMGGIAASLAAVALLSLGVAPGWTIAIALLGVAPQAYMLKRYYAAHKTAPL